MKDKIRTVYFAKAGSKVKIGVTNNIEKRLPSMQTGCPDTISIVLALYGSANDEKEYHDKFKHLRIKGEWFHFKDELKDYVEEMNKLPKVGDHAYFWATGRIEEESQYEIVTYEKAYYWIDGLCVGRTPRGALMLSNTNHCATYAVPLKMFSKETKERYLLSFESGDVPHDAYKVKGSFHITDVSHDLSIKDIAAARYGFVDRGEIKNHCWVVPRFCHSSMERVYSKIEYKQH